MKAILLSAISAYQRYLSPHKGFRCAYHAHTGRGSCSGYGHRVIARFGAVRGMRLLRRRLRACGTVASQHPELSQAPGHAGRTPRDRRREGGFLDGCDAPGCDGLDACDLPLPGTVSSCVPSGWRKRCETVETILWVIAIIVIIALVLWFWLKKS